MPPIYHRRLPDPAPLAKTPADLVSYGPQLPITLSLPAGDSPQGPSVGVVGGNALIDTRAGYTCVNVRAMQAAHQARVISRRHKGAISPTSCSLRC